MDTTIYSLDCECWIDFQETRCEQVVLGSLFMILLVISTDDVRRLGTSHDGRWDMCWRSSL